MTPYERNILRGVVVERYQRTCQHCHRHSESYFCDPDGASWNIDHLIPRSAGGADALENFVLSCSACNNRKSDALFPVGFASTGPNYQMALKKSRYGVSRTQGAENPRPKRKAGNPHVSGEKKRKQILDLLAEATTPLTRNQLAHCLGVSLSTVDRQVQILLDQGRLEYTDEAKRWSSLRVPSTYESSALTQPAENSTRGRIFRFVRTTIERTAFPPTYAEIGAEFGISTNSVHYHLHRLEAGGLLTIDPMLARSIRLTEPATFGGAE